MSYLVNRAQTGSLIAYTGTNIDASVLERRCREFGASTVVAYIVASWLAAGDESGKREVCRGRGTRLKLTDAAKYPSGLELASASPSLR